MMHDHMDMLEEISNPLDCVEDVLTNQDWTFNRQHADELTVYVNGRKGQYRLTFIWQEAHSALQFFCEYDFQIPAARQSLTNHALRSLNQRLWLGHFDLPDGSRTPTFRYTSLLRGWAHTSSAEQIEDLVDIALAECETHSGLFAMLASDSTLTDDMLTLMLTDEAGAA